jgi:hypothetical protein
MSSESWGGYIFGLVCLLGATLLFFWGSSGIFKRQLHWQDNSEYSSGAQGTVRGGSAVGLGFLIVLISLLWIGVGIYFLSGVEWAPLSWVVFLRLSVLVLIIVGAIALGILTYRGKRVRVKDNTTQKATFRAPRNMRKLREKYKGKLAPLPYDPTWLVELAKEQIPEETDIIDSLKLCTTIIGFCPCGCGAPYFLDPESDDWELQEDISLFKPGRWGGTTIFISVSTNKRIASIVENEPVAYHLLC